MGTVTAVLPAKEVWAGTYGLLTHGAVVKDWDFHSGLVLDSNPDNNRGIIVKVDETLNPDYATNLINQPLKGKTVKLGENGLIVKFTRGYKSYDEELFDIYVKITAGPTIDPKEDLTFYRGGWTTEDAVKGSVAIMEDGSPKQTLISICTGHTNEKSGGSSATTTNKGTDFNYEIWLRHNPQDSVNPTNWSDPPSDIDKKEMFVGGSNFMSGIDVDNYSSGASSEGCRPWSQDETLYSNDNKIRTSEHTSSFHANEGNESGSKIQSWHDVNDHHWSYDKYTADGVDDLYAWVSHSQYATDKPDIFVIGYGYTDSHSIKGGYTNKIRSNTSTGKGEIILGYRVRKVIFEVFPGDAGYNTKPSTSDEYLESSYVSRKKTPPYSGNTTYMPNDVFDNDTYLKSDYVFSHWTTAQDVELQDGRKILAGSKITEADMPLVKIRGNEAKPDLVFYAHTIPKADAAQLIYHFKNEQIPQQPGHTDGDTNLIENYKLYKGTTETEDPTSNGSLKPGVVITGKDDQKYRLVGWFEDEALTDPYEFGENLTVEKYPTKEKHIYAKWVVVEPPKPGPDPEPTPDSPSDSGSTPASATVAPAAPAPLPAGTVRVSPKTGDTTIPPIYYVMSAAALAGIGFLVFRRRGKN